MIAGNLWEVASAPKPPRPDPRRQPLPCFTDKVLAQTRPGDTVYFVVAPIDQDGGLVNHRLRYALPLRYVTTTPPTRPHWTAVWKGGCEGLITR